MRNLKLGLGLVLLIAVAIFSIQNAAVVDVKFLIWKFTASLALVILATLAAGVICGWGLFSALAFKRKAGKDSAT